MLVMVVWKLLKNQENQKVKICQSPKNYLSQENQKAKNWKNHQKVGIYLILTLQKRAKLSDPQS